MYFHHQYQLGFHETRISSPLSGVVKPSFLAYSLPVDVGLVLECGLIRACRGANGSAFWNGEGMRGGMGMKRKSSSCPAVVLGKAGSRKMQQGSLLGQGLASLELCHSLGLWPAWLAQGLACTENSPSSKRPSREELYVARQ